MNSAKLPLIPMSSLMNLLTRIQLAGASSMGKKQASRRGKAKRWRRRLFPVETLESRLAMATAGGVENVLLPEFMAQQADPNGNQLPASDAWWALRSQRNMAIDEPISNVQYLGAHNAFNALNEGFHYVPPVPPIPFNLLGPNQLLSLTGQLDVGARLLELDIHDPQELYAGPTLERRLILRHGPFPSIVTRNSPYQLDDALTEIQSWLTRPENRHEIVFLDFEDGTEQAENNADDPLIPKLLAHFGSQIYRPDERAVDGAWPSRSELLARGKNIVIFTHRNDTENGRFGVPQKHTDLNGHTWFGAGLAFRADGENSTGLGNFVQISTDDFSSATVGFPENADSFFAVQGDGIRNNTARRFNTADVQAATRINVNFTKMDFLFTDDEDAGLGGNFDLQDVTFDIPEDNRVALLESAVWSWKKDDPAVDRQIFQDLTSGDGTGIALLIHFANRIGVDATQDLSAIGASARNTNRDVAIQQDGRWVSTSPNVATPRAFAARSVTPDSSGRYQWRVTTGTSQHWGDGYQMVRNEFGSGFEFAGPVNGFQNAQLADIAGLNEVWLNVHDFDRHGNWKVGNAAPQNVSMSLQPATITEGQSTQLSIAFHDEPGEHQLLVDWGDGSPLESVPLLSGVTALTLPHIFLDDPINAATSKFTIKATISDQQGLTATNSTEILVMNVAPSIGVVTNSASSVGEVREGQSVHLSASFADPGILDTHVAWVNWGDGSALEFIPVVEGSGSGSAARSHVYLVGGIYSITFSVQDDDGDSTMATTKAFVSGIGLNQETLYVIGTRDKDNVNIDHSGNSGIKVKSNFIEREREFALQTVQQIVAYLGDGDDHFSISNKLVIPTIVHGGNGDDYLSGGGPIALLGEQGDDQLTGDTGRSLLFGGIGMDRLTAGKGGDVLIGGQTSIDENDTMLMAAMLTWNSNTALDTRIIALNNILRVFDDLVEDRLTGGQEQDLIFEGLGDILKKVRTGDRVIRL